MHHAEEVDLAGFIVVQIYENRQGMARRTLSSIGGLGLGTSPPRRRCSLASVVLPLLRTCCAVAAAAPMACGRAAGGARHARLQWRHGRGDAAVLGSAQAHARH